MSAQPEVPTTQLVQDEPGGDRWTLNFGPQHPATHGTLHLKLELDGERIVRCVPEIGYLHCGFEKLGEHLDYNQYVVVTDRMNYLSPAANNLAWHHACETLFGIDLTPRCKVLRTLFAELARILDHFLSVGAAALDLGALTAFVYGFNEREIIYDLFEEACGARFTVSISRVGGVFRDIPPEWPGAVKENLPRLAKCIDELEGLLVSNRIFIERTKGVGVVGHDDAIDWSLTGPAARASGVKRDLRKDEPYLCFAENWDGNGASPVPFKVPIAQGGDCYARFLVRLEEMRQSIEIIQLLIDNIPPGEVNVLPNEKLHLPDKREIHFSIEGLIHHFEMVMTNRGFTPPLGEAYGAMEAANGELGYYIVSDGGRCAYRARCRPPSLMNYQAFPMMIEGHQISDIVAVLGSMNIIAGELDR